MTRKLSLTPDISYMLGIYSANRKDSQPIRIDSRSKDVVEKFIKIAIGDLAVEPQKIMTGEHWACFYNSKIKKLFGRALERRIKTFKYFNEYSGSYVAGLFDCSGGMDRKGIFIRNLDAHDGLLLENIGIHTRAQGSKSYIIDEKRLVSLISGYSCIMRGLMPGRQQRRRPATSL